jgi:hypothetical protein
MKKILFLTVILSCVSNKANCQPKDTTNIYLLSLTEHLEYIKKLSKDRGLNSIYVEKNELTTESLPNQIGGITILYLTPSEIQSKTRGGKQIHLVVIRPVKVEAELLKVGIIDFYVTTKKKNFNYANTGGSTLRFKYSCERNKFELFNKKQGGI